MSDPGCGKTLEVLEPDLDVETPSWLLEVDVDNELENALPVYTLEAEEIC